MLQTRVIPPAEGAYQYPLLIKRLLMSGARYEKTREIVYRDQLRYSYPTLIERVARLANVLTAAGVKAGDTVAVMDWDSHRYLECMFAIPMIGAVIHTINVRLSPEQILYTMNHAEDRFVLVNSEFVGLYQAIAGHLTTVEKTLLLTDLPEKTADLPNLIGEYEQLLAAASTQYDFQDFDETQSRPPSTPPARLAIPKACISPIGNWCCTPWGCRPSWAPSTACDCWAPTTCTCPSPPCSMCTPGGCRMWQPCSGSSRFIPVATTRNIWWSCGEGKGQLLPLRADHPANGPQRQGWQNIDFGGWKIVIGGSALNRTLYDAAKAKGIQLTAAYGMSETGPLVSCAHLNDELMAGTEDERTTYRIKAGVPGH